MPGAEIRLEGLQEIKRILADLGPKIEREVMQKALFDGARVIRDEAQRRVPVKSGTTQRNIFMRRSKRDKPGAFVTVRKLNANEIKALKAKQLLTRKRTLRADPADPFYWRFIEFGFVHRGGTRVAARPFLRPAFEATRVQAVEAIGKGIGRWLVTVNARLVKKGLK